MAANLINAGQVDPGDSDAAGTLTIQGAYTQTADGALNIELGGITAGSQYDRLSVTGAATLTGAMRVALIDGFVPTPGQMFQPLTYSSLVGSLGTIDDQNPDDGVTYQAVYNPTNLTLNVI